MGQGQTNGEDVVLDNPEVLEAGWGGVLGSEGQHGVLGVAADWGEREVMLVG